LLQPVWQLAHRRASDVFDLEEVDDLLDLLAMLDLFLERRAMPQHLPEDVALHQHRAAGHDVLKRRHALEQRDVLDGTGDTLPHRMVRLHRPALLAAEGDGAYLRRVEAIDDIEHRRLARAIRPDDGADL